MPEDAHASDAIRQLMGGGGARLLVDHRLQPQDKPDGLAIFPGAFNPLHTAHQRISLVAEQHLQRRVAFELSVENVDKPPLTASEVQKRVGQFASTDLVFLTRAATFAEKASLFGGVCFLAGADTIDRIADARYYANDRGQRDQAIADIAARGCSFLVFGRLVEQAFLTLDDLALPAALRDICQGLDERAFRIDVSSTELR